MFTFDFSTLPGGSYKITLKVCVKTIQTLKNNIKKLNHFSAITVITIILLLLFVSNNRFFQ